MKEDLIDELELLHDVFIANGYPGHLVRKTIKESWSKELMRSINTMERNDEDDYRDVIHAPYVKGFSEELQCDLSKLEIGFVMKKGKTLHSELCKLKIKKKDDEMKNVVYCINCKTCQRKYIGETSQQFCTRKYQHNQDIKKKVETNGIYHHLKEHKKHKIDWDGNIFLDREAQWTRRKIKESLYINACDPRDKP